MLTETKKKGHGEEYMGDFVHFWSGVDRSLRAKAGVSIVIKKSLKNRIREVYF